MKRQQQLICSSSYFKFSFEQGQKNEWCEGCCCCAGFYCSGIFLISSTMKIFYLFCAKKEIGKGMVCLRTRKTKVIVIRIGIFLSSRSSGINSVSLRALGQSASRPLVFKGNERAIKKYYYYCYLRFPFGFAPDRLCTHINDSFIYFSGKIIAS